MNGCGVCNQFSRCISGCRYYSKEGRIEDEEVLSWYDKRSTPINQR
jgi:hypothetical protein